MNLLEKFKTLTDPRVKRTRKYPLADILIIVLCALICSADTMVAIVKWADSQREWLKENFGIEAIPSHDTIGRVLAKIDPKLLAQCLTDWATQTWSKTSTVLGDAPVVAFDGKRLKGALGVLNLVTAWASDSQLILAVAKAKEGADEQEVMRKLLALLNLEGCLVTADALHTQVETAQAIRKRKADYLLALKNNQGQAYESAQQLFDKIRAGKLACADSCLQRSYHRGVREERRCWVVSDVALIDPFERWPDLKNVVCVERICFRGTEEKSRQIRYFLSSASGRAGLFLRATRGHWGIENSQHWRLDVFFREDLSRVSGNAAVSLGVFRRLALSLLKRETSEKVGVQTKRHMAGWDVTYLEKVLAS